MTRPYREDERLVIAQSNKTRERYIRRRKKRNEYYIELEEIEKLFNKLILKMHHFMEHKYLDKAGIIYLLDRLENLIEQKARMSDGNSESM